VKLAAALLFVALAAAPARAERLALLIGVGEYPDYPAFHLDGPSEDVPAIRAALVRTWNFPEKNIRTLVDRDATKAGILAALDTLAQQVKPGDEVFIYYSGHGTSALDPNAANFGLPVNSGALVPYDIHHARPAQMVPQLVIGAIDLKPRLQAIDRKASVFVVFDSCYSGAAVKSLASAELPSRGVPFGLLSRSAAMDDYDAAYTEVRMPEVDVNAYPYQHLIFLAAASQSEKARDASRLAVQSGIIQTVDGKPHGLLTDSLLRAFRGDADENHDGKVTYDEVRRFAMTRVMNLGQTPQLLPANDPRLTDQPIFAVAVPQLPPPPPPPAARDGVAVHISPAAQSIAPQLARLPGVRVAQGQAADLAILRAGDRYELYIANGIRIHDYRESEVPRLLERVRREPEIRMLRDWTFPRQAFHADLQALPAGRDAYALGESVVFQLRADRASYLLLLNVDVSGEVTVVYKSPKGEPARSGETVPVKTCIGTPAGTEYMKLFAFAAPPAGWDEIEARNLPADGSEFEKLMAWLKSAAPDSAQTSLLTYSTDRRLATAGPCMQ
jgi:hypothetical protein